MGSSTEVTIEAMAMPLLAFASGQPRDCIFSGDLRDGIEKGGRDGIA